MMLLPGLAWLLLVSLLPQSSTTPCVNFNVTGCLGCGSSTISCPAFGFTEFPSISVEDATLVEMLDLSHNELTIITAVDLQHFTQLEELKVIDNEITYIEEGSFSSNQELSMISLESNPLLCDCGLRWLWEFLQTLPVDSNGRCGSPTQLAGSLLGHLNLSQLTCECPTECGGNSSCNALLGLCECDPGYRGDNCSQVCLRGTFGSNCSETCTCEAGSSCHHITGDCTCPPGYLGTNCSHDCSGAPECALLGREACSLDTPENTCGACRTVPVGNRTDEWGNDTCVTVSASHTLPLASTAPGCKVPVGRTGSQVVSCVTEASSPTSSTVPHCKVPVGRTGSQVVSCVTEASSPTSSTVPHSPATSSPDPSEGLLITFDLTILLSCLMVLVVILLALTTGLLCWRNSVRKKAKILPSQG